ncbi:hypothetical protein OF117_02665 [Geodermatophilus sp. YIM 151500]|uniref:hypothetical protein n=1 Tax=Geodermatophilus sp. YIM 151500 TaxID=2984531 RepID=UPI0021E46BC9|nr:hypothetical protein [Geodermatophilus sp. YIM 151500]MCV2488252.1 hypothetical protein [Geodermatophilus sp. YIM 151500]
MGDGEVHLGDVGDASAHGLGELLAQVLGLLADQHEGVAGLEGGDADRATGAPVDQHAQAVEAH